MPYHPVWTVLATVHKLFLVCESKTNSHLFVTWLFIYQTIYLTKSSARQEKFACLKCLEEKKIPAIKQILEIGKKNDGAFKGNVKESPKGETNECQLNLSVYPSSFNKRNESRSQTSHPSLCVTFSWFQFQSCGSKPGERFR